MNWGKPECGTGSVKAGHPTQLTDIALSAKGEYPSLIQKPLAQSLNTFFCGGHGSPHMH